MPKTFFILVGFLLISHLSFSQEQDSICKCLAVTDIKIEPTKEDAWEIKHQEKNVMLISILFTFKDADKNNVYLSYPGIEYVLDAQGDTVASRGNTYYEHSHYLSYINPTKLEKLSQDTTYFVFYTFDSPYREKKWITCKLPYKQK